MRERSLVFEYSVNLRMTASIKLAHLKGDFAAFGVAFGCLIPLIQLADLIIDSR
jgi:hypothetical protein